MKRQRALIELIDKHIECTDELLVDYIRRAIFKSESQCYRYIRCESQISYEDGEKLLSQIIVESIKDHGKSNARKTLD